MKQKVVLLGLLMMSISGIASAYGNNGQVVYFTDECGRQTGTARKTQGGRVDYYDECGRQVGSARKTNGGQVQYYDECGRYIGSSR